LNQDSWLASIWFDKKGDVIAMSLVYYSRDGVKSLALYFY